MAELLKWNRKTVSEMTREELVVALNQVAELYESALSVMSLEERLLCMKEADRVVLNG